MREEFEKLPEIRDSLSEHIVFIGNKYTTPNPDFYDLVNWLNGAWYAFQEQQAEIARLQSALDELKEWCRFQLCENDGTQWDAGWCASHRRILNEINRITGTGK